MFEQGAGLLILCFAGASGFFIFKKLGLPLPALLGSLSITAALALSGRFPEAPVDALSSVCKIAIGVMMGRRINRNSLFLLKKMLAPALVISLWMLGLSVVSGFLLSALSGLPLPTALIGSATGGISEMAIFALSKNYDAATVAIIGVARLIAVIATIPFLARRWGARGPRANSARNIEIRDDTEDKALPESTAKKMSRDEILLLAAFAVTGGALFAKLGIPAGLMLGALAATASTVVLLDRSFCFPQPLLASAQIGIGITIARQFGAEQLAYLSQPRFIISLAICSAFTILAALLLALLLRRITGFSFLTCLLSASAGGLSQIVIIAEEMDADALTIGILHLARYLAIVSCMPFLISLLLA